jgi:hypothetical protein
MTDIEERLRHDLNIIAERAQPGSIKPLQVPPAAPRRKAIRWPAAGERQSRAVRWPAAGEHRSRAIRWPAAGERRSRAVRWLAPATAVAAVIAIIVGVSLAGHPSGHRPVAAGRSAGMPKYYVTLKTVLLGKVPRKLPTAEEGLPIAGVGPGSVTAIVRDSLTGARLGTLLIERVPRGKYWVRGFTWITAAANDHVFAIGVLNHAYILRLRPDGQPERLSPLPTVISKTIFGSQQLAVLSPAGTELAFTNYNWSKLTVVTLATGAARTWLAFPGHVEPLQWPGTSNNILVRSFGQPGDPPQQFRLLDLSGAGGDVLADSRLVLTWPPIMPNHWNLGYPLLAPDGKLLFSADAVYTRRGVRVAGCGVLEYSALTGRLLRVLHSAHAPASTVGYSPHCTIDSVGPTGLNVLIEGISFGRLDGSGFTTLPSWDAYWRWPQAAW